MGLPHKQINSYLCNLSSTREQNEEHQQCVRTQNSHHTTAARSLSCVNGVIGKQLTSLCLEDPYKARLTY